MFVTISLPTRDLIMLFSIDSVMLLRVCSFKHFYLALNVSTLHPIDSSLRQFSARNCANLMQRRHIGSEIETF